MMSKIHNQSVPCTKSELDLFVVPNTQIAITSYQNQWIQPNTVITPDSKRHEYPLPRLQDFNDLYNAYMFVEFQVKKISGGSVVDLQSHVPEVKNGGTVTQAEILADKVLPTQYLLNTMFNTVELYCGNKRTTPQNNMYHYKAYFEALFFTSKKAKKTIMKGAMWGTEDERMNAVSDSKVVQLYGRLHVDLMQQHKLIPPDTPLRLVFHMNPDSVIFKSIHPTDLKPKFYLRDMKIKLRKYGVDDEVRIGIENALLTAPAKYFITRAEPVHLSIPTNVTKYIIDNAIKSILPRVFIIGIIPNAHYAGSLTTDVLKFAHHNLNYIAAYKGGQMINSMPFTPDYDNNLYIREYIELYKALGQDNAELMNLSFEDFKTSCCFYAFNLTPDFTNSGAEDGIVNYLQSDSIQLEFGFKTQTTQTYSVVVLPLYDSVISINSNREAFTDY